jgi:uncharacterized SAM-binding protein YcdF (DUF218 family)
VPRSLRGDIGRLILAALAGVILLAAYTSFRIWQQGDRDDRAVPVDAVVVLGAAEYNGVPSAVFKARITHAVELVLNGAADRLIVTGGRQPGDRFTEAGVARAFALANGVPADHILAETTGRDTLESLVNVAAVMRREGLHRALFVSDRTHMLRVLVFARELGIEAYGSPTASSPTDLEPWNRFFSTVREMGALAEHFFLR